MARDAIAEAARLRREAHEKWQNDDMVRALLEERQGYVQRADAAEAAEDEKGAARLRDRVAQVDEQLRIRGADDQIPKPARRRPAKAAAPDGGAGPDGGAAGGGS